MARTPAPVQVEAAAMPTDDRLGFTIASTSAQRAQHFTKWLSSRVDQLSSRPVVVAVPSGRRTAVEGRGFQSPISSTLRKTPMMAWRFCTEAGTRTTAKTRLPKRARQPQTVSSFLAFRMMLYYSPSARTARQNAGQNFIGQWA